jgi:hypothetical protein
VTALTVAIGVLTIASHWLPVASSTFEVAVIIGMAVGVDHSLFYLRREREEPAKGWSFAEALRIASRTSGRTDPRPRPCRRPAVQAVGGARPASGRQARDLGRHRDAGPACPGGTSARLCGNRGYGGKLRRHPPAGRQTARGVRPGRGACLPPAARGVPVGRHPAGVDRAAPAVGGRGLRADHADLPGRTAAGLLGYTSFGGIIYWAPLFMFVFLFGISMDCHVFILGRIRELWSCGSSPRDAVVGGIASSGGLVTSAPLIMVAVFSTFATLSLVDLRILGVGMAAAVLIDATVVRGILLPAVLSLLGDRAWSIRGSRAWPAG